MRMIAPEFEAFEVSNCAEVLVSANGKLTIGYKLGGHTRGPELLVVGFAPVAPIVFERLLQLPTLGWLRGTLTLLDLSSLDDAGDNHRLADFIRPIPDRLMFLPYAARPREIEDVSLLANQGYWKVLRLCAQLRMISGRGVPELLVPVLNGDEHETA